MSDVSPATSPVEPPADPRAHRAATPTDPDRYDVVVVGGAFSGAASALLVRRFVPDARVLVVERAEEFDRKVGEATVEISSFFLHRVLGLFEYLGREHISKHGLRYWFHDGDPERDLADMAEVGPKETPRVPSYQLDRSTLDEHLLRLATEEGAELERPAKVSKVELGWPESRITLEPASKNGSRNGSGKENGKGKEKEKKKENATGGASARSRTVTARWVIDASGRHAFLARRLGYHRRTEEHPTAAIWGRWTGIVDLDGPKTRGADPRHPRMPQLQSSRRQATNHFCGHGWWCWMIPLKGGQTSVGLVYNKELLDPPGADARERYLGFLHSQPGLRELLEGARLDEDDFRSYSHLPYRTEHYAGMGWAMVGDAASFLDPYYSPGLDHASMTIFATARLIEDDLTGVLTDDGAVRERVEAHDRQFLDSYERWLHALYVGKYELLGDAELTASAFLLDTALYYIFVVSPIHRDMEELRYPMFGKDLPQVRWSARGMRAMARRLVKLARKRRRLGIYGRRNVGWRNLTRAPGLGAGALPMLFTGLGLYLRVEIETFWAGLWPWKGRRVESGEAGAERGAAPPAGAETVAG